MRGSCCLPIMVAFVAVLASCGSPLPPTTSVTDDRTCENPIGDYRLTLPEGWFAHPADPRRDIEPCTLLGPAPFTVALNASRVLEGQAVRVGVIDLCLGREAEPDFSEDLFIDGFPARREESSTFGHFYWYVIVLPGGADQGRCEIPRFAFVRTDAEAAPDFEANKRAVDEIALSLDFGF